MAGLTPAGETGSVLCLRPAGGPVGSRERCPPGGGRRDKKGRAPKGTVLEHLLRACEASWKRRGPHGMMRVGFADWNDSLNPLYEKTESVFTSCLFCRAASDLALRPPHWKL